jgi:2-polyprenyl-3-methyl-5-hydroxy-6-metoxy-1,4-benzoquinol methylase
MYGLVPTREEFERRVPAEYRRYAGIGPYFLPVFGRMYSKRLQDLIDACTRWAHSPARILDVGCGLGLATSRLAELFPLAEVSGLDIYPDEILRVAAELRPAARRVNFVSGSIEEAPFESGQFDLVTAFDALEHVPHPEIALQEIVRILSPQGISVISVPIESVILRALRYVALGGGRKGEIHPHWEGTFSSIEEFENQWNELFVPLQVFTTPIRNTPRVINYDVVYVGRARQDH